MQWREVRWVIDPGLAEEASERLVGLGETGFVVSTRSDGLVDFTAYGADCAPTAAMELLAELGARPTASADLDEAALYLAFHPEAPVPLTADVWVLPRGDAPLPKGALGLHLPVGPAWGDGRHPTTRLAAGRLTAATCRNQRVLDLGCGSGLLGVLASKRGAASVDLADLDEHGLRIAKECCAANHVNARIFTGDLLAAIPPDTRYDLIVANLWADLVLALLADPRLDDVLAHGRLILAGIGEQRRDEVVEALHAQQFRIEWEASEAWWWSAEVWR